MIRQGNDGVSRRAGWTRLGWLGLLTFVPVFTIAATPAPVASMEEFGRLADRFEAATQEGDCRAITEIGSTMVSTPGLPEEAAGPIYFVLTFCAVEMGKNAKAAEFALSGTRLESAPDELWDLRYRLQLDADDLPALVETLETMTQGRGAALNAIDVDVIFMARRRLKDSPVALKRRFLLVMLNSSYDPPDLLDNKDSFVEEMAQLHVAAGEPLEAKRLLSTLRSPYWIGRAQIDPNFRGLVDRQSNIRAVAEQDLVRQREQMALAPDRLRPVMEVSSLLRMLGRPGEALPIVTKARDRAVKSEDFLDQADNLPWIYDELAKVHRQMGRYDEMVAAYRAGAELTEGSSANVSQIINLAAAQEDFAKPDDALETIAVIDREKRSTSGYGRMLTERVQLCAKSQKQQTEGAREHLVYIRANQKDAERVLAEAQLCLGDLDQAASAFIARLDDPEKRVEALIDAADFDEPAFADPDTPAKLNWKRMMARPDVKAALERAGGVPRFNVQHL